VIPRGVEILGWSCFLCCTSFTLIHSNQILNWSGFTLKRFGCALYA
jgi:hypothetical protein